MSKGRALLSKLTALFSRRTSDREFESEISEHLGLLQEEFERRGLSPEDARYAAQRQFGGVSQLQQIQRENRSIPQLHSIGRDLRVALRTIRKSPWFSVTVIVMLALGIGANSAIFTLADQMLLRLLPAKDPRSLVLLNYVGPFIGGSCRPCTNTFSYPAYSEIRDRAQNAFTGIAARYQQTVDIAVNGAARRAQAELVSGNYFEVLGVSPALGRM